MAFEALTRRFSSRTSLPTRWILYTALILGAIIYTLPFVWMLSTSLKTVSTAMSIPPRWIPSPAQWTNYIAAWNSAPFPRLFFNSATTVGVITMSHVVVGSMAAYAFARLRFPGRDALFLVFLATMMIPGQVLLIPNYVTLARLNWIDTYYALVVPLMSSPFSVFVLRQAFLSIPRELEEAAVIDGCSWYRILWQIIIPVSKPALITVVILVFTEQWNNFLWPLVVTNSMEMRTVQVGLAIFQQEYFTNWPQLMAAATFVTAPTIIVFLVFQKYFIQGVATSGLKQ